MREQFEISTSASLTEVRDGKRVRYTANDGDTMITISTNDPSFKDKLRVSKYPSSHVRVVITIDHNHVEYKDTEV